MIFEDAHWADPSSLEVFGRLVDEIDALPVLPLVTYQPEFSAPWIGRPHVAALTINRLTSVEVLAPIEQTAGNGPLPANIRQDIVERADGVPLFVEEMTKAVMGVEGKDETAKTAAAVPRTDQAILASLHASLMARLDRLGNAKAVAQIGAAMGREFSHALLSSVSRETEAELGSSLDRLIQAGLLYRQGSPPHATYLFKHALVQDTAYGTLLREPRRALHARIANALETGFADVAESRPELLAQHFTEAGQIERAAALWAISGLRAAARSALIEAEAQLTRGQADRIAAGNPLVAPEQIKVQIGLANTLMATKGFAATETKDALEKARASIDSVQAVGEVVEDPMALFSTLYDVWTANYIAFNGDAVRKLATQYLVLARQQAETLPLVVGHRLMRGSLLPTGDIFEGRAHLDRAAKLYDPGRHRPLLARFGLDVGVVVLSSRAISLWLLGYPAAARADIDSALSGAREIGHAAT